MDLLLDKKRHELTQVVPVISHDELMSLKQLVNEVHVGEKVARYALSLVTVTRMHPDIELGISPRGSLAFLKAAQAFAVTEGRDFVTPLYIKKVLPTTFRHRLLLSGNNSPTESQLNKIRVETKIIYTGDGWEDHQQGNLSSIQELPYEIRNETYYRNSNEQFDEALIELEANATFIPLPYGQVLLTSGNEYQQIRSGDLSHDLLNNRLHLMQQGSDSLNQFHITSTRSERTPEALRNVNLNDLDLESLSDYLQLPSLPVRISDLALQITEDRDSLYDQVIAIESFLRESHFKYSKIDTPFMPVGRDYKGLCGLFFI